jgi:hypothetical protein
MSDQSKQHRQQASQVAGSRRKIEFKLIIVAIVLSFMLFGIGLLSGLSYSRYIEQRTSEDIRSMLEYVHGLDTGVRSLQLQESFIAGLQNSDRCRFSEKYYSQLMSNLSYYWNVLPKRLEEYEFGSQPTNEYIGLKKEYTRLSLRAWMIARANARECDTSTIPVLYLYKPDCQDCIAQGKQLDLLKDLAQKENLTALIFTVDYSADEPTVTLLLQYFDISRAPALVIGEQVLQGNVTSAQILLNMLRPSQKLEDFQIPKNRLQSNQTAVNQTNISTQEG